MRSGQYQTKRHKYPDWIAELNAVVSDESVPIRRPSYTISELTPTPQHGDHSVMCSSIILGLGLMGVEEIIIGDAVYIDIPQSSTGVYDELATEVVPSISLTNTPHHNTRTHHITYIQSF